MSDQSRLRRRARPTEPSEGRQGNWSDGRGWDCEEDQLSWEAVSKVAQHGIDGIHFFKPYDFDP